MKIVYKNSKQWYICSE